MSARRRQRCPDGVVCRCCCTESSSHWSEPCDSPGRGSCLRADRHGGAWAAGAGVAGTSAGGQRRADPAGNRPRRPGPAGASAREAPAARRHDGPARRAPAHRGADGLRRRREHRAGSRRFPSASAGAARDRGRQQQQGPHGGGRPRTRRHRRARVAAGIRPVRLSGTAGGAAPTAIRSSRCCAKGT